MSTIFKRFSFLSSSLCYLLMISGTADAQTWYDSEGRALTVNGKEIKLKSDKEKRKVLPLMENELPRIISEKSELLTDTATEPIKLRRNRIRSNFFFSSFNNGIFSRNFNGRRFTNPLYNFGNRYTYSRFRTYYR